MTRLLTLIVCLAAPSALAQSWLADGSGAYLALEQADVRGADGRTAVTFAAGWRSASGVDAGVHLDTERARGLVSSTRVGLDAGRTWGLSRWAGARLSASAGYAWRTVEDGPFVPSAYSVDGAAGDLQATVFARVGLGASARVQPTTGVFVRGHALGEAGRTAGPGPLEDLRDAGGVVVGLPVSVRVLGADLALAPVVRLGVGLQDHAFYTDGAVRAVVNF